MKINTLLPWVLAGGLVASTLWNLQLVRRLENIEAHLDRPTQAAPAIPVRIVSELGLTDQQCEIIRGCSMT